jgi:hypothetical protein
MTYKTISAEKHDFKPRLKGNKIVLLGKEFNMELTTDMNGEEKTYHECARYRYVYTISDAIYLRDILNNLIDEHINREDQE